MWCSFSLVTHKSSKTGAFMLKHLFWCLRGYFVLFDGTNYARGNSDYVVVIALLFKMTILVNHEL